MNIYLEDCKRNMNANDKWNLKYNTPAGTKEQSEHEFTNFLKQAKSVLEDGGGGI